MILGESARKQSEETLRLSEIRLVAESVEP